ncbi:threonine synthase [candidate division KSB1 bacterium]|nr:threonine synthase [candidate division KSB1 bacterium]
MLAYSELAESIDRYDFWPQDWLPVEPELLPDYSVGGTPLIAPERLRAYLGYPNLYLKDDSMNPSGSLKDRASFLVAGMARKIGKNHIIVASTGNSASSMAGLAAATGMKCTVLVPEQTPVVKLVQCMMYGATVIPIRGDYDKAYELSMQLSQKYGWVNRNAGYNPFTMEGKKTVAIEMYQQLDDQAPDNIFIPTGDGAILSGIYKGFYDLFQLDLIEAMPRLIAVQPEKSNALIRALTTNSLEPLDHAETIADSLCVRTARNGVMAVKDIHKSCGFGVPVTDEAILEAQEILAKQTGLFVEPAAACSLAGFLAVKSDIDPDSKTVLLLTGTGLKNPAVVTDRMKLPEAVDADIKAIAKRIELNSD